MGEPHNSASSLVRFSICVVITPGDLVINGLNLLHPLSLAFCIARVALVSVTARQAGVLPTGIQKTMALLFQAREKGGQPGA